MKNTNTRKLVLSMQVTLDGYVSGPNEDMSWLLSSDAEWDEMFKDLQSADIFLMGAHMYPGYAQFWTSLLDQKDADPNLVKFAKLDSQTPHVVFSKSLKKVDFPNYRIATDAVEEITKLKQQAGKDIYVWGGADFANSLINGGLIDEYRISLNPTLLGGGKNLFHDIKKRQKLELINTRPLKTGLVILNYRAGN